MTTRRPLQPTGLSSDEACGNACAVFFEDPTAYLKYSFQVQIRARVVRAWMETCAGKTVVDVGCGNGGVSRQFLPDVSRLVLIDGSRAMLDAARSQVPSDQVSKVEFVNTDIRVWTPDAVYDVAICMGVLAYFRDPEDLISRLAACLKPGGLLCLQLTDADRPLGWLHYQLGVLRNSVAGRAALLSRCDVKTARETSSKLGLSEMARRRFSLLLPGMGVLPDSWLLRWEMQVLGSRLLSWMGSECILLFQKAPE